MNRRDRRQIAQSTADSPAAALHGMAKGVGHICSSAFCVRKLIPASIQDRSRSALALSFTGLLAISVACSSAAAPAGAEYRAPQDKQQAAYSMTGDEDSTADMLERMLRDAGMDKNPEAQLSLQSPVISSSAENPDAGRVLTSADNGSPSDGRQGNPGPPQSDIFSAANGQPAAHPSNDHLVTAMNALVQSMAGSKPAGQASGLTGVTAPTPTAVSPAPAPSNVAWPTATPFAVVPSPTPEPAKLAPTPPGPIPTSIPESSPVPSPVQATAAPLPVVHVVEPTPAVARPTATPEAQTTPPASPPVSVTLPELPQPLPDHVTELAPPFSGEEDSDLDDLPSSVLKDKNGKGKGTDKDINENEENGESKKSLAEPDSLEPTPTVADITPEPTATPDLVPTVTPEPTATALPDIEPAPDLPSVFKDENGRGKVTDENKNQSKDKGRGDQPDGELDSLQSTPSTDDLESTVELDPVPTAEPTPVPTAEPTAESTPIPTLESTPIPTTEPVEPTSEPTPVPTVEPTPEPLSLSDLEKALYIAFEDGEITISELQELLADLYLTNE